MSLTGFIPLSLLQNFLQLLLERFVRQYLFLRFNEFWRNRGYRLAHVFRWRRRSRRCDNEKPQHCRMPCEPIFHCNYSRSRKTNLEKTEKCRCLFLDRICEPDGIRGTLVIHICSFGSQKFGHLRCSFSGGKHDGDLVRAARNLFRCCFSLLLIHGSLRYQIRKRYASETVKPQKDTSCRGGTA